MSDTQKVFYNTAYECMNWTVPVFFMITGALLLDRDRQISEYDVITKYCRRILLALLIFGFPFSILKEVGSGENVNARLFFKCIEDLFTNGGLSHLWYLYDLIGLYIVTPFVKAGLSNSNKKSLRFFGISFLIMGFLFPTISSAITFNIPFAYYLFYFIAGYYFSRRRIDKRISSALVISMLTALVMANFFNADVALKIASYNSPVIAFLSIGVFTLFNNIEGQTSEGMWKMDRLCFGVYLVHPVFIQAAYRELGFLPSESNIWVFMTIVYFCIFSICAFITSWLLRKIRFIRKYVL